jgi:tetratricopeptide (TPR) repeat protein
VAQGGSSWAHYLLGTMELASHRGRTADAVAHLREAVARDPDLVPAWRTLGRALERMRATTELKQLQRDYRARFNASLPN